MDFIILVLFLITQSFCVEYLHTKNLALNNNKILGLSWEVTDQRFKFKLSSNSLGALGLAFSYSDLPLDGVVIDVQDENRVIFHDLHLDYAGKRDTHTSLQKPNSEAFKIQSMKSTT